MPAAFYDMVQMTVTGTPGTGTITLGSAAAGFRSFASAGVPNGQAVAYLVNDTGNAWELNRAGVYSTGGTTLTRSFLASSTGSQLSLTSAATVSIVSLAEDLQTALYRPVAFNGACPMP